MLDCTTPGSRVPLSSLHQSGRRTVDGQHGRELYSASTAISSYFLASNPLVARALCPVRDIPPGSNVKRTGLRPPLPHALVSRDEISQADLKRPRMQTELSVLGNLTFDSREARGQ